MSKEPTKSNREASVSLVWNEDQRSLSIEEVEGSRVISKAVGHTQTVAGLIKQLATLGSYGKAVDEDATNFVLGYVEAMKPRDATEALLLAQMGAAHQATMMMARRLNHVENIPQQDAAERALNKLARTFSTQVETLKRYRSTGKQVVRVERVNVESGGQAIVGDVSHGGRAEHEK
ncbi:hypothetical protein BDE40_1461 [Litoreibacter halocynthiae]|uniref:Uncharacterized protein n=1 Tax=Litoreibacter halocynthiae TaxID=1242689 RepID=A0A4V6Q396_9RHOB|nr:hypothetical protein [Litoreibacter halocynthiae]TDT74745.1 hypothetical protein BDE40_1461 [Litoreibacter halocynthiae]